MDLQSLQALATLAETLNFRRAAARLNMTQPALSLRLKRLEDELGLRLFDRSRASVALSEVGRQFLPHAQRLLGEASAVRMTAHRIAGGDVGRLRVGYTPVSFFSYVPEVIRRFATARPEVEIDLVELLSNEVEAALVANTVDVGFLHPPVAAGGLSVVPLPGEGFVIALSSHDPLAGEERLRLADLADRDFVLTSRRVGPALFDSILTLCRISGFEPRVRQEVPTSIAVLGLVAAGHGVGLVIGALSSMTRPGVAFVPIDGAAPHLPFALATREGADAPLVRAFVGHVRAAGTCR